MFISTLWVLNDQLIQAARGIPSCIFVLCWAWRQYNWYIFYHMLQLILSFCMLVLCQFNNTSVLLESSQIVVVARLGLFTARECTRSNLRESKIQKFPEGACSQTSLEIVCLCTLINGLAPPPPLGKLSKWRPNLHAKIGHYAIFSLAQNCIQNDFCGYKFCICALVRPYPLSVNRLYSAMPVPFIVADGSWYICKTC